jgi:hypothetical protein
VAASVERLLPFGRATGIYADLTPQLAGFGRLLPLVAYLPVHLVGRGHVAPVDRNANEQPFGTRLPR